MRYTCNFSTLRLGIAKNIAVFSCKEKTASSFRITCVAGGVIGTRKSRAPREFREGYAARALILKLLVCRSCIVQYLDDSDENECPKCCTVIHETNPQELLR